MDSLNGLLHDFVREQYGEDVEHDLDELAEMTRRINKCLGKNEVISYNDFSRYNDLTKKLFPQGRGSDS